MHAQNPHCPVDHAQYDVEFMLILKPTSKGEKKQRERESEKKKSLK